MYELWMQYTVINTEQTGIADVENAINEICVPRIGVRIHIVPVFIGNLPAETAYAAASGEKIDLVNVGLTNDMSTLVSDGLLLPLDDLLREYGKDALRVTARVADAQKIGGVTYAVSQYPYAASCSGFLYNRNMAEEYGINMHDGMTLEELEAAGEILSEQGICLTAIGLSSELSYKFFTSMETFGEAGNYGVILDPEEQTQIVNIFASEELKEFYTAIRNWYVKGFLPADPMLNEPEVLRLFAEQKLFCVPTNVNAGQLGNLTTDSSFTRAIIRTSDILISTSSVTEFMLGIAASCRNPEAAMKFINLIYEDPEVADLLNYGVEGTDYVPVEGTEHVITREGTPNEDFSRYGSGFTQFGDPLSIRIPAPLTDDYYRELKDWEEAAHRSGSFGYSFDASDFAVEARSIARIIDEYLPILNIGMAENVDAELDAMNCALEAAGINEIIAANNEQLKAYLAGN
ncbi:MAG: ABC transporter substrate-binding protein [Parasporobacterium sp.]|nr:ABC transporter substrate-binding protein [Parasporobacterium sp.]